MPIPRNPVVRAGAILRKGGVHTKSASGLRHQSKRVLDNEIDEWFNTDAADADSHLVSGEPTEQSTECVKEKEDGVDNHPSDQYLSELTYFHPMNQSARCDTLHNSRLTLGHRR